MPLCKSTLSLESALFAEGLAAPEAAFELEPLKIPVPVMDGPAMEPWFLSSGGSVSGGGSAAVVTVKGRRASMPAPLESSDMEPASAEASPMHAATSLPADSHMGVAVEPPPGLLPPPGMPSHGSALHSSRRCKPCAWFHKASGCSNGNACKHCHLCPAGEIKARKKSRCDQMRLQKALSGKVKATMSSASTTSPSTPCGSERETSIGSASDTESSSEHGSDTPQGEAICRRPQQLAELSTPTNAFALPLASLTLDGLGCSFGGPGFAGLAAAWSAAVLPPPGIFGGVPPLGLTSSFSA